MKKERTKSQLALGTMIGVVVLLAIVGCINITIKVTTPQGTYPPPPGGGGGGGGAGDGHVGGGVFVPVQALPVIATAQPVCTFPVSTTKVTFSFTVDGQSLLWQTNPPTATGFKGTVVDLDNNSQPIANTDYYLQMWATASKKNCCTNVLGSGTQVGTNTWPGVFGYRFTAFFKVNHLPPATHKLQLQGEWTQ